MLLKPDCLVCLFNQALRVTKALECDEKCAKDVLDEAALTIAKFDLNQTPPEAAAILYPKIANVVGKEDLYEEKKIESINRAFSYLDFVYKKIDEGQDPLDAALRAAVAGNVIDFATEVLFDIQEEIAKIFEAPFAIDEKRMFLERLAGAKSVMIVGDNVGEHLFDRVLLELIEECYPDMDKYYVVRGKPIINDVTASDAKAIDMDKVCEIIDSGVDTPGFIYERANERTKKLFDEVDLILAKGMGNFECMDRMRDDRLFFLFKIKCGVVAKRVGKAIGDLICVNAKNI